MRTKVRLSNVAALIFNCGDRAAPGSRCRARVESSLPWVAYGKNGAAIIRTRVFGDRAAPGSRRRARVESSFPLVAYTVKQRRDYSNKTSATKDQIADDDLSVIGIFHALEELNMNEKKLEVAERYMKPELEVVELSIADVIATSCSSFAPDENEGPLNDDF